MKISTNHLRSSSEITPYRFSSIALLIAAFTATVQILSISQHSTNLIVAATCFAIAIPALVPCAYYHIYAESLGIKVQHPLLGFLFFLGLFTTVIGFIAAFSHISERVGVTFLVAVVVAFLIAMKLESPMMDAVESAIEKKDSKSNKDGHGDTNNSNP